MSEYKILKAVDRWNATADRTIDDQDQVIIEVKDGDKTTPLTMTVAEFRNSNALDGTSDERTKALEGANWYSLDDGAALKEFSLAGRINTSTSSLPIVNSSMRFTDAILGKGREVLMAVVDFAEGVVNAVMDEANKADADPAADDDTEVDEDSEVDEDDGVACDPDVDEDCEVDDDVVVDEDEEDCEVTDDEEEVNGVIEGAEDPIVPADGDPQVV
ncbi:MAG TPA: hypothetical protein VFX30_00030 [bacterium]|nr:hypothetical protein [bacterium]